MATKMSWDHKSDSIVRHFGKVKIFGGPHQLRTRAPLPEGEQREPDRDSGSCLPSILVAIVTGISQQCMWAWENDNWRTMQMLVKSLSLDFEHHGANSNLSTSIQGVFSNCAWCSGSRTRQFICPRLCKSQAVCSVLVQPVWKTTSDWQLQWRRAVACKCSSG